MKNILFIIVVIFISQCRPKNEIALKVGESQTYLLSNNTLQNFNHQTEDTVNLEILFGILSKVNIKKISDSSWNVKLFLDSIYLTMQRDTFKVSWNSSAFREMDSSFFAKIFQPYKDNALEFQIVNELGVLAIPHISNYLSQWEKNLDHFSNKPKVARMEEADLLISQRIFLTSMLKMTFFYPGHPIGLKERWQTFIQIPDLGVNSLLSDWIYSENHGNNAIMHGKTALDLKSEAPQNINHEPFEYRLRGEEKSKIVVDKTSSTIRLGESDYTLNGNYIFSYQEEGTEVLTKIPVNYSGITSIKTYFAKDR